MGNQRDSNPRPSACDPTSPSWWGTLDALSAALWLPVGTPGIEPGNCGCCRSKPVGESQSGQPCPMWG